MPDVKIRPVLFADDASRTAKRVSGGLHKKYKLEGLSKANTEGRLRQQHSTAQHSTAQHSTVRCTSQLKVDHSTVWQIAQHS